MYHLVNNLATRAGDALSGYYVKLKDSEGAYATLYSDANSTPIATVSGETDAAKTDDDGMYDIYVEDGDYDIEFFDKNDVTKLVTRIPAVPMYGNSGTTAVLADLASAETDKGSAMIVHRGEVVRDVLDRSRGRAYVTDQPGATAYDRMQYAMEACAALAGGGDVFGDPSQIVSLGSGQYAEVPSKVEVHGHGMRIDVDAAISRPVRAVRGGEDIGMFDMKIDCKGQNTSAGVSAEGVHGFTGRGLEVMNFVDYSIDIYSDKDNARAAQDVELADCYAHTPAAGTEFSIVMRSVTGGPWVKRAKMLRNFALGCDPNNRPAEPGAWSAGGASLWTADQIVMQGVEDFQFIGNRSLYSGAAACSLSRGCKNGLVQGNVFGLAHESFNIGSGIEFVYVADLTGFVVGQSGDQLDPTDPGYDPPVGSDPERSVSSNSGVSATSVTQGWVTAIVPDSGTATTTIGEGRTGPGWIWVASPSGGLFTVGQTIVQGRTSTTATDLIVEVRYAAQDIDIIGNTLFDTGIKNGDSGDPGYSATYGVLNFIRAHGDMRVLNNRYYDASGIGKAAVMVANSNSLLGVGENYWNGLPTGSAHYALASPAGAWAWQAIQGTTFDTKAAGRVQSAGSITPGSGYNATSANTGTGQYTITVADPLTNYATALIFGGVVGTSGELVCTFNPVSNTEIQVRIRDNADVLTNASFYFEIKEIRA